MKVGLPLVLAGAIVSVAVVQSSAARACASVRATLDMYLLPPPDQLAAMSLGYRSALADLLWADVLVTQGFRLQERRHNDTIVPLMDGVTLLDPQFREPYLYSDALITFQSVPSTRDDAYGTRRILERGVKNRPLDADLWLNLGTFVCFLAPSSVLTDEVEQASWRRDGAAYLERAVELAGNDSNIAWQALGGGVRFERMGERAAAIRFYRKVLETTDDEDLRARAQEKLDAAVFEEKQHGATDQRALQEQRIAEERERLGALASLRPWLRTIRRQSYSGFAWDLMMAAGPPQDSAKCAARGGMSCDGTWSAWARRRVKVSGAGVAAPSD